MGGFVRVFSSRNGSGSININNQIMFSSPVILYSYDDYSYKAMPNKRGFSFTETKAHADNDHEGVALAIAGLDPVKEYTVTFTLRASRAEDCTWNEGKSNAVGFTQSLDNIKDWDKKLFGITDSSDNAIYKSMRFDNGILNVSTIGGIDFTNYIPITSVTTTPTEYSLTIKRGCNGVAFLCFELAYPNTNRDKGPMVYYFENFSITDTEMAISEGEPMSLYCYSEDNAHINGYTEISNLNIATEGEPRYQVVKVNVRGKCANGKVRIQMKYGGSSQSATTINLGEITGEEDVDVTYTLGITGLYASGLTIVATYNPGIYDDSGSYVPIAGIYSDDLIDITCTATGSDSVLFQNSYKNPSGNMYADNVESEEVAHKIATDVGIIFKDYGQTIATYTTYENTSIVSSRAALMNYNVKYNGSVPLNPLNPFTPSINDNIIGGQTI